MTGASTVSGVTEFLGHHEAVSRSEMLPADLMVDKWRIMALIGRGGSSEVYRVVDDRGKSAALKILTKDDVSARARFAEEITLYQSHLTDSLPRLYGRGDFNGHPYLVYELLESIDTPSDDRGVAGYLLEVCQAVSSLHSIGLVHRDLKPSNIMRRTNGELVLIDLGLVKDLSRGCAPLPGVSIVSERVMAVGTPSYAAPEQMQGGEISAAADIHAIGRIANVLLGERVSSAWAAIIRRATSSVPSMRYHSVEELAAAIRRRNIWRNLRWTAEAVLGVMVLSIAVGRVWQLRQVSKPSQAKLNEVKLVEKEFQVVNVRQIVGPATYYVNSATGNDANSGLDEKLAKKTIQSAIDTAEDGSVIIVSAGHYAPIVTQNRSIIIRSDAGYEATIIDGEGKWRCADLGSALGETNTVLEGFSLLRGLVKHGNGAGARCGWLKKCFIAKCTNQFDTSASEGGGAWGSWAEDCEFAENTSTHGGGLASGWADRCIIRGNHARDDGGGTHSCTLRNCLVVDNSSANWGGGGSGAALAGGKNYNCTIIRNVARHGGGIIAGNVELVNCILFDNHTSEGNQVYRQGESRVVLKNVCESDPRFVDEQRGNFNLAADSPCIDAGDNSYVDKVLDLAGNARIVNGAVDLGCYERPAH